MHGIADDAATAFGGEHTRIVPPPLPLPLTWNDPSALTVPVKVNPSSNCMVSALP
jgi:hypothetical protein